MQFNQIIKFNSGFCFNFSLNELKYFLVAGQNEALIGERRLKFSVFCVTLEVLVVQLVRVGASHTLLL